MGGGGKLTPRQKMINMMYLVLTALLALNVSAEILNAFVLVDESLMKTGQNIKMKNDAAYSSLAKLYSQFPKKVEGTKKKADQITIQTEEIIKYISELQNLIVKTGDGTDQLYIKSGPREVKKKDDNNVPGTIMIVNKKGEELKKKIELYREMLIGMVSGEKGGENVAASIKTMLSTEKISSKDGVDKNWENANFENLPLSAVITMLTKFKTDIRNSEGDVIAFLMSKIGADDVKVNKIEAIVKTSSNYVLVGEKFNAEVFIAAYDSMQVPEVILNGGRSLEVISGKGMYAGNTGSAGMRKETGEVKLKLPSGEIKGYPFSFEYQVAMPSVSVSPTKMNVFYIGVDNPVDITAAGVPQDKMQVSLQGAGTISSKGGGSYVVKVSKIGTVKIAVSAEGKSLGTKEFRCKIVPDPVATIGADQANWKGGTMQKNALAGMNGVNARMENFDFALKFTVTSFTCGATINGFEEDAKSSGGSFSPQQRLLISKIKTGQRLVIDDIKASGEDGSSRKLNNIVLKLK